MEKAIRKIMRPLESLCDYFIAFLGAATYGFPSHEIVVVVVTGTKGKSTVMKYLSQILAETGNSIHAFDALAPESISGHFAVQRNIRNAIKNKCSHVIIEIGNEAAMQHFHRFLHIDALLFTNLFAEPEHIELHGSYEAYKEVKFSIVRTLSESKKHRRMLVLNGNDDVCRSIISVPNTISTLFAEQQITDRKIVGDQFSYVWNHVPILGRGADAHAVHHAHGAATCARALGVPTSAIVRGISAVQ
jgi:UDP-N-acetylmuramyl tripeptide synthase